MDEGANEMTTSDNAPTIDILECYCTLKIKDGRTTAQHEAILSEILECAHVDPVDLLAEHQHLGQRQRRMCGGNECSTWPSQTHSQGDKSSAQNKIWED